MAARRLEVGEHGAITYSARAGRVTASMYYRNGQGQRRRVEATADTKTAAHRAALEALQKALASSGGVDYNVRTTFGDVAGEWFARFAELVAAGRRSPSSAALYRATLDRHVLPAIGGLRLNEVTPARMDAFLHGVLREKGHGTAKVCRSVVSGVCGLAVRRDALRSNPVRDVGNLERGERRSARALTADEARSWLALLDANPYAVRKDLPDLTRFLLGTGVRIGEALAVRWADRPGGGSGSHSLHGRSGQGGGAGGEVSEDGGGAAGAADAAVAHRDAGSPALGRCERGLAGPSRCWGWLP